MLQSIFLKLSIKVYINCNGINNIETKIGCIISNSSILKKSENKIFD